MKTPARITVSLTALMMVVLLVPWHSRSTRAQTATLPAPRAFPSDLSQSSQIPVDVDEGYVDHLVDDVDSEDGTFSAEQVQRVLVAQREFDILAWQAFLALNWPHETYARPKPSLNDSGDPLWSYWVPKEDIFLPNGAKPTRYPWNPEAEAEMVAEKGLELTMRKAAWRQTASAEDNFQAFSGPLVDQSGKWVRYEAMTNPEEFEYIYHNELYSLEGQIKFSHADKENNQVVFPVNEGTRHGAIEIKLAWKELAEGDDKTRFYTKEVCVTISEPDTKNKPCKKILAGLVGMHISMHTKSSPEWIWATFEQIDNVRQNPLVHGGLSRASFNSPTLNGVPVNVLPPMNGDCGSGSCRSWYEHLTTTPVQVKRIEVPTQQGLNPFDADITKEVAELNAQVQGLLGQSNSVFRYYELIGTQWPLHKYAPAFAGGQGSAPESITNKTPGDMVPVFLVNSTMETYFQKGPQAAGCLEQDNRLTDNCETDGAAVNGTESCSGCHYSAGICIGYKHDLAGNLVLKSNGAKTPVYGENGEFGRSAHAHYSWLLQIETDNQNIGTTKPVVQ